MLLLYCLRRKRNLCNVIVVSFAKKHDPMQCIRQEDLIMQFCWQKNRTLFAISLVILQRKMALCNVVLFLVICNVVDDFAEKDDRMQCFFLLVDKEDV